MTAYETVKKSVDKGRAEVNFQVDDQVWLSSRNFTFKAGAKKFAPRYLGPFKISEVLGPVTYRLELPEDWKLHNVFHVSLLRQFLKDERFRMPEPVRIVDGVPEWEVEAIVNHRFVDRKTKSGKRKGSKCQYLVHWKGYGPEWQSWLPERNCVNSQQLINAYWQKLSKNPEYGRVDNPASTLLQVCI